eukprot:1143909-Pelagomonas_calceolata.AAC.1
MSMWITLLPAFFQCIYKHFYIRKHPYKHVDHSPITILSVHLQASPHYLVGHSPISTFPPLCFHTPLACGTLPQAVADAAHRQASWAAQNAASAALQSTQETRSAVPEPGSVTSSDGSVTSVCQGSHFSSVDGEEGDSSSEGNSSGSALKDDEGSSSTEADQAPEDEFLVLERRIWEGSRPAQVRLAHMLKCGLAQMRT